MTTQTAFFPTSIYTMRHSSELDYLCAGNRASTFVEGKSWITGARLFQEALQAGQIMPVIFSAAETSGGLIYFAHLTAVKTEKDGKHGRTTYSFENLTRIAIPKPLSILILESNGTPLSNDYIRPYAVCGTPPDLGAWTEGGGLPPIRTRPKTGEEVFCRYDRKFDLRLLDFWRWSASDLIGNTERGVLAEFIVASALGLTDRLRIEWDAFDLLTPEGVKIEVKSAAYIQTWYQKQFSDIVFKIRKTRAWDVETNVMDEHSQRQADLYVFCLLKHKVQETLDPLDLEQWEFYVVPTKVLNEKMNNSGTITLARLKTLAPNACSYAKLREVVRDAAAL